MKQILEFVGLGFICLVVGILVGKFILPTPHVQVDPGVIVRPDSAKVDSMKFVLKDLAGRYDSLGAEARLTDEELKVVHGTVAFLRERIKALEDGSQNVSVTVSADTTLEKSDTTVVTAGDSTFQFVNDRKLRAWLRYDILLNLFELDATLTPSTVYFAIVDTVKTQSVVVTGSRSPFWYESFSFASGVFAVLGVQNNSAALEVTALVFALVRLGLWVFN